MIAWLPITLVLALGGGVEDELDRLEGHQVERRADGSYRILDIAGRGAPLVGVVEMRGKALLLRTGDRAYRLRGPLAHPRMAGPGYKIWVIGKVRGPDLIAERLGVLAPPKR
ncbi:MAG: hypothetical protein KJO07_03140 [Deltaproteobacteria bacterium]|nr:hypothetical protein [Deltaproteobacteria bacterium]